MQPDGKLKMYISPVNVRKQTILQCCVFVIKYTSGSVSDDVRSIDVVTNNICDTNLLRTVAKVYADRAGEKLAKRSQVKLCSYTST